MEEKEKVYQLDHPNGYEIKYSDGSVLIHKEDCGYGGISSDTITETLKYIDGTQDVFEYVTTGSNSVLGIFGKFERGPQSSTIIYRDGTKCTTTYERARSDFYDQDKYQKLIATTIKYNKNGKFIGSEIITYRISDNTLYGFGGIDPDNKLFKGYQESNKKIYDEKGNLIEQVWYTKVNNGRVHTKYVKCCLDVYTYDDSGNLIKVQGYDPNGQLIDDTSKQFVYNFLPDKFIPEFNKSSGKLIEYDEEAYNKILITLNEIDGSNIESKCSDIVDTVNSFPDKCSASGIEDVKDDVTKHTSLIKSLSEMTNYSLLAYQQCDEELQNELEILINSLFQEGDIDAGILYKNVVKGATVKNENGILEYEKKYQ